MRAGHGVGCAARRCLAYSAAEASDTTATPPTSRRRVSRLNARGVCDNLA
jgi:hypothetical protein